MPLFRKDSRKFNDLTAKLDTAIGRLKYSNKLLSIDKSSRIDNAPKLAILEREFSVVILLIEKTIKKILLSNHVEQFLSLDELSLLIQKIQDIRNLDIMCQFPQISYDMNHYLGNKVIPFLQEKMAEKVAEQEAVTQRRTQLEVKKIAMMMTSSSLPTTQIPPQKSIDPKLSMPLSTLTELSERITETSLMIKHIEVYSNESLASAILSITQTLERIINQQAKYTPSELVKFYAEHHIQLKQISETVTKTDRPFLRAPQICATISDFSAFMKTQNNSSHHAKPISGMVFARHAAEQKQQKSIEKDPPSQSSCC